MPSGTTRAIAQTWLRPMAELSRPSGIELLRSPSPSSLLDGQVLVIGGGTREGPLASAEIFDPPTRTWTLTAPIR